jgi:hypothetical protein
MRPSFALSRSGSLSGLEYENIVAATSLIVPQGSLTTDREETIACCRFRAGRLGVAIIVIEY